MNRPIYMKLVAIVLISLAASMGVAAVPDAPGKVTPLDVGDMIPDVSVRDADGQDLNMRAMVTMQPAVIIFYRGGWCPYCNKHLAALADIQDSLNGQGYQILAISPDKPAGLAETTEKNELGYLLFSDSKAKAIEAFGLGFKVEEETLEKYKGYGIDLEAASGRAHHILPVPAVYLVDHDGKILFRYYNPDYKVRLSTEEILAAAKANAPKPVE